MYTKLKSYAANFIGNTLGFDKETCNEMVEYSLNLQSEDEIQSYFFNILGDSENVLRFIETYFSLKQEEDSLRKKVSVEPKSQKKNEKAGVWGQSEPETPKQSRGRVANNTTSATTSELLSLKPSNQLSAQQAKRGKKKNLNNLKDVEAALNELESASRKDEILKGVVRRCNCMATRHPLFEVAPNCLNCGKIICEKEGLQPCSYCGQELLSPKDKQEIIEILKQERDSVEKKQEKVRDKAVQQQESPAQRKKKIVVQMRAGENMWKAQDRALKEAEEARKKEKKDKEEDEQHQREIEAQEKELERYASEKDVDADLINAQNRLESLLDFQATGAERTKIIDNASDFEMPTLSNSGSIWLSPVERALHLKKQQKNLRKYEQIEASRKGRGKKAVEMVIRDGKVTMVEKWVADDTETPSETIADDELVEPKKPDTEVKKYWDYEKDHNKWEKPQYKHSVQQDNDTLQEEPIRNRVQFPKGGDDELLVMMPS
ncbi:hypothetical protein QFC19_007686 [Naganishia cerealis]|uniref:Uncharacterized protein n=1 Tax=Naganishia cerealis TaxID=610337 RepID=A0ACC2V7T3_9TREE|nr:hypothetical protein QFC19_007686 [Naganishia cerealis]